MTRCHVSSLCGVHICCGSWRGSEVVSFKYKCMGPLQAIQTKMCVYRITAKETQTHTTHHLSSFILLYLSSVCVAMFVCVSLFCPWALLVNPWPSPGFQSGSIQTISTQGGIERERERDGKRAAKLKWVRGRWMQKQEKMKNVVWKGGETGESRRGELTKEKKLQEVKKRHWSHNHREGWEIDVQDVGGYTRKELQGVRERVTEEKLDAKATYRRD